MFNLTYTAPTEIKGTIRVNKRVCRLGPMTDAEGRRWDVCAVIGDVVCAVPIEELHPYYTDTSGAQFGFVSQTWEPYQTEIVDA